MSGVFGRIHMHEPSTTPEHDRASADEQRAVSPERLRATRREATPEQKVARSARVRIGGAERTAQNVARAEPRQCARARRAQSLTGLAPR